MSVLDPDLFIGVVPFVATAEARSFRGAARQLGVTCWENSGRARRDTMGKPHGVR